MTTKLPQYIACFSIVGKLEQQVGDDDDDGDANNNNTTLIICRRLIIRTIFHYAFAKENDDLWW